MKKLLLLSLLTLPMTSFAGWQDSDWYEPSVGCLAAGGLGYMTSSGESADKIQTFAIGCAIGAVAGNALNNYYDAKVGVHYKNDIDSLKNQLKGYQLQRAAANANGIGVNPFIKTEVVEGTRGPDGSYTGETLRYTIDSPGRDLILGD